MPRITDQLAGEAFWEQGHLQCPSTLLRWRGVKMSRATPWHPGAAALPVGPSVCVLQPCGAEPWGQGQDGGTGGRAGSCTAATAVLQQYPSSAGAPCRDRVTRGCETPTRVRNLQMLHGSSQGAFSFQKRGVTQPDLGVFVSSCRRPAGAGTGTQTLQHHSAKKMRFTPRYYKNFKRKFLEPLAET